MQYKLSTLILLCGLLLGTIVHSESLKIERCWKHCGTSKDEFVKVENGRFVIGGKPYIFVGTNMWYGAYLGALDPRVGDRQRLIRELDLLKSVGINNVRILGASEDSSLVNAINPAFHNSKEILNGDLLVGLDFLLSEMAKRDMKAVIYLNNFWEWSGGMATYLSWVRAGEIVDPTDPKTPWPAFALFTSQFYSDQRAKSLFNRYVRKFLSRKNSINGRFYRDDPVIMSWQLANEPRPGDGESSYINLPAYYEWISDTAMLIKSLAPRHLVSIGSEGTMGCLELDDCIINSYLNNQIDYMTFHMWPKNWGWYDVNQPSQTFNDALSRAGHYIDRHKELAHRLKLPLVLEEFGLERDYGGYGLESSVLYRDKYFQFIFSKVEHSVKNDQPFVGTNFWAWGGFGRAEHEGALWKNGDRSYVGDPPQEPQGLNSVFNSDQSTLDLIVEHKNKLRIMNGTNLSIGGEFSN